MDTVFGENVKEQQENQANDIWDRSFLHFGADEFAEKHWVSMCFL